MRLGRRAADEHAVRGRAERGGHVVVAQAVDGRGPPRAARLDGERHGCHADLGARFDRQRTGGEVPIAGELGAQAHQSLLRGRVVGRAVKDDGDRLGRAAGEVALQREQPLLGHAVVRQRRRAGGTQLQPEDREGERQQDGCGGDQADRRTAHDREHGAPPERALFAGRGCDAPPEPRHPQALDAIAEDHQDRGMERERDDDRDQPDDDGAQAEAAQGGVGHEQHRDHRQRERGAAEDDRACGGVGDGQDRLACAGAAVAFLAQAGDDEQ